MSRFGRLCSLLRHLANCSDTFFSCLFASGPQLTSTAEDVFTTLQSLADRELLPGLTCVEKVFTQRYTTEVGTSKL